MAKDSKQLAGALDGDGTSGLLSRLLAEENEFDRRTLWRIGSWGVGAVGAVVVAVISNQSSLGWRREQVAAIELARQAQQIQSLARESQNEARRLASAVDTLNSDRDRLYSRVTVLEQGLDSVTGAIARQSAVANTPPAATTTPPAVANVTAAAPPALDGPSVPPQNSPAPTPSPVATTTISGTAEKPREAAKPAPPVLVAPGVSAEKPREVAKPAPNVAMTVPVPAPAAAAVIAPAPTQALGAPKSMMGPPDPAAPKMVEAPKLPAAAMAAVPPEPPPPQPAPEQAAADIDAPKAAVQRTDFAVDLGGASSIGGLRALWRGLLKSNAELAELHPIIVVKESTTGLGMQLRLAAGPLHDAAAAAKICAALLEGERGCETTVFDGQRLAMAADDVAPAAKGAPAIKPVPVKRGYYPKRGKKEDTPAPKQDSSTLSTWFSASKRQN